MLSKYPSRQVHEAIEPVGTNDFEYVRPATLSEAIAAAAKSASAYLGSDSNLLDLRSAPGRAAHLRSCVKLAE